MLEHSDPRGVFAYAILSAWGGAAKLERSAPRGVFAYVILSLLRGSGVNDSALLSRYGWRPPSGSLFMCLVTIPSRGAPAQSLFYTTVD